MAKKKEPKRTERFMCHNHTPSLIYDKTENSKGEINENCPTCKTDEWVSCYSGDRSPEKKNKTKKESEPVKKTKEPTSVEPKPKEKVKPKRSIEDWNR